MELCIAKRQKDKSVLSPASLKNAAAFEEPGAGGAGRAMAKIKWLPRKELEDNLPEAALQALWLAGKWTKEEVFRALKQDRDGLMANSRFENLRPLWGHRLSFYMGKDPRDTPDLNVVGKNLALVTRMCLGGKEPALAKMVTEQLWDMWDGVQDKLASQDQIPESDLRECFECIEDMMAAREEQLALMVAGCGPSGEEVLKGAAFQTKHVRGLWDFLARGLSDGRLTSPTRKTANAVWMTVLGPAMDQRTNWAPNGSTDLTAAQARLDALRVLDGAVSGPVRRQLASAMAPL
jgi:hypothetical protein